MHHAPARCERAQGDGGARAGDRDPRVFVRSLSSRRRSGAVADSQTRGSAGRGQIARPNLMRITFVLNHVNLNGGIRVIAIYAERLKKRGHQVTVVTRPRPVQPLRSRVKSLLKGNGWPIDPNTLPDHFDNVDVDLRVIGSRRPIVDRDVPDGDVVIATWWETADWVNALSPSKGGKAYFVQDFGAHESQPLDKLAATWRMPMHLIVISNFIMEIVKKHAPHAATSFVPNSVDLEQFQSPP